MVMSLSLFRCTCYMFDEIKEEEEEERQRKQSWWVNVFGFQFGMEQLDADIIFLN